MIIIDWLLRILFLICLLAIKGFYRVLEGALGIKYVARKPRKLKKRAKKAEQEQRQELIDELEKEMDMDAIAPEKPKEEGKIEIEENEIVVEKPIEQKTVEQKPEEYVPTPFTINQWVSDTVDTILDVARYNKNPTDYDERILEDFHEFIKNENFFKIPLPLLLRMFQTTQEIFSVEECQRIFALTLKYHNFQGLQILQFVKCSETDGKAAHAVLMGINTPITTAIYKNPFEKPEFAEDTSALEKELAKLTVEVAETNRKLKESQQKVSDLEYNLEILTKYKQNTLKWPRLKENYSLQIKLLEEENEELQQSIDLWKPCAMQCMKEPEHFVNNIFKAIEFEHIPSVAYLVQTDETAVRQKLEIENETWWPLMYSCKFGCLQIVQLLITYGAAVNKKEWHGTALSYAKAGKFDEIVEYLIEKGATQ